ncbi:hypothetical protein [Lyngbya aestuarii]|uniref:hypothetical protein n=1 Tax=Lyngbya aestuarii TaxID=118322 RepID=UPI00403E30C2
MNIPLKTTIMVRTKYNLLERWNHLIKEWFDLVLRQKKGWLPKQTILNQRPGKGCILLQLERNTPGAISTWRFNCELLREQSLLLTLDNIVDLERHFQRANRQTDPTNTTREVVNLPTRLTSHRIGISLVYPLKRTEFIGVWDINLIDQWATVHAEDYKAEKIILYIALRVLSSYEIIPDFFEQEIRSKHWWEQRLLRLCAGEFAITHKINLLFCSEINSFVD